MKPPHLHFLTVLITISLLSSLVPSAAASANHLGPGNQGKYGDRNAGYYVEYSITGVDMAAPRGLPGGIFRIDGIVTSNTVSFTGTVFCGVGKGAVTDCLLSADLSAGKTYQSYRFPEPGKEGWISDGKVVEKSFSWTATLQPGDSVSFSAAAQICGGICVRANVAGDAYPPTPAPTRTITPTIRPTVTRTPNPNAILLSGKVSVPSSGVKAPLPPGSPADLPLQNVALILYRYENNASTEIARTFSLPLSGDYEFTLPAPGMYLIQVDLRQGFLNRTESFFNIQNNTSLAHGFAYVDARTQSKRMSRNISFSDNPDFLAGNGIPADRLQALGLIYYFTHQALDLATQNLAMGPKLLKAAPNFHVRAFAEGEASSAYYGKYSEGTDISNGDPHIVISKNDSLTTAHDLSFTTWHEFGHYVMSVAYDGAPWAGPTTQNHNGFLNPNTTDSWVEGWATFYAMMVGKEIARLPNPAQMYLGETLYNYEINYRAWANNFGLKEESAVSSLLWDLVDPIDAEDVSLFVTKKDPAWYKNFGITLSNTITAESEPIFYGDYVQVSLNDLWKILSTPSATGWNDRSPDAPPTYNYIFDVRQLYSALKTAAVGATYPDQAKARSSQPTYKGLSPLDELFIAHAFFADVNPQNLYYDINAKNPPEEIGYSSNRDLKYNHNSYPTRLVRRIPPPLTTIYLGYKGKDTRTNAALNFNDFTVSVQFDSPFQKLNYTYRTTARNNGKLYLALPDWNFPFKVTVTGGGDSYTNKNPMQFTSDQFWQRLSTITGGPFSEYTFELEPRTPSPGQKNTPAPANTPGAQPTPGDEPPSCASLITVLIAIGLVLLLRSRYFS
ncbi:MAG TPA: hypothetical protein VIO61_08590 [Anaerolineaceae bacterium]